MMRTRNMSCLKAWPSFLLSKEYETWNNSTSNNQILLADKRDRRFTKWNIEYISKARKNLSKKASEDFKEISKNQPWVVDLLPLSLPSEEYEIWDSNISDCEIKLVGKRDRQSTKLNIECPPKTRNGPLKRANEDYTKISKDQPWIIDLLQSVKGLPICVSASYVTLAFVSYYVLIFPSLFFFY